jgi:hypothetical protein
MTFRRYLPSNALLFDVRRDMRLVKQFDADLEALMETYRLTVAEKRAFREKDLQAMLHLGVHPYFITQIVRLYYGSARNDQSSAAIAAYRRALVGDDTSASQRG